MPGTRRPLALPVLVATAAFLPFSPGPPAAAQTRAEVRWVAYVRSDDLFLPGSLHIVHSTGGRTRVLARQGVLTADLGPEATAFAVRQETDDASGSSVVRVSREAGEETLLREEETSYLSLAAGPAGELAVLRFVPAGTDPPRFLRGAIATLSGTGVPILTPPRKPRGPVPLSTVPKASPEFYELRFTNDPEGEMAHVEQFNLFVSGSGETGDEPPPDSSEVEVRGTSGSFFCGASTCFLSWEENESSYMVGEFGGPEDAAAFAESLAPIEEVAGDDWRFGGEIHAPQLVARFPEGGEVVLESVDGFCECGFQPVDWDDEAGRVLVIQGAEGFTTLAEYPVEGGDPEILAEGDLGEMIIDAAFGPEGILVLVSGETGPAGDLRTLDGESVTEDVRAFDVEGTTLAYVDGDGRVVVRNLRNGRERTVGRGAVDVSVSPDLVPAAVSRPPPEEPGSGASPTLLGVAAILGALALLGGGILLGMRLRRR